MENTRNMPLRARLATRNGALAIAVIAGGLAAILVFAAINSARNDGTASTAARTVLVANQVIPKGSSGQAVAEAHLFRTARVGEQTLVAGAITDISQLRDKVSTQDIYPGQQISARTFTASNGELTTKLTGTDRAIAIPLDSAHGLVGEVNAGDRVDILAGFNVQGPSSATRPVVSRLASNVLVLKTAKPSGGGAGGGSSTSNVTLRVSAQMATKLAFAADNGKVWIVLRPAAGAKESSPSVASVNSLLFGVKPLSARGRP